MRRTIASWLMVGVVTATACAPAAPTTPAAPAPGQQVQRADNQVLRVAQTGIPASLSPEVSSSNFAFFSAIFDPLVTFKSDFSIVPQVAERWEFRDGNWRFTIRRDVRFTDGTPLTAEDVAFTANLIAERRLPQTAYLPALTGARVVDQWTVDLLSRSPDVSILNGAAWIFILPKAYYERVGREAFQTRAIGSGPYEVVEYRPSDLAVFRMKAERHPFRDVIATELRFQTVPETSAVASGLRTGDIDLTAHVTFSVDQIEQLRRDNVGVQTLPGAYIAVVFSQPENQDRATPLRDRRVREALNYAIDRETIARSLFRGFAQSIGQFSIPSSTTWLPDAQPYRFDPQRARQLLAEAGYPNGFRLPTGLDFTPTSVNPQLALAVQGMLRDVGVEANVNSHEIGTFLDKFYGRNGQTKAELWVFVSGDANGMGSVLRGNFGCDKAREAIWWCNQQFNEIFDRAMAEPNDARRIELLRQAHRALLTDIPGMPIVASPLFITHGPRIQGVEFTTPLVYRFDNAFRAQ